MLKLLAMIKVYKEHQGGATAIEYGLIAAGISLAIAAVVFAFGEDLTGLFDTMGTTLSEAGAEAEAAAE